MPHSIKSGAVIVNSMELPLGGVSHASFRLPEGPTTMEHSCSIVVGTHKRRLGASLLTGFAEHVML